MSRLLWLHIQRVYKKKKNYQVVDQCVCSSSDLRNQPYRRADGGRRSAKWKPGQQLHVSSDISLWRKLHRTADDLKTIRRRTRLPPSCMLRATEEKLHDPERRSLNLRHKLNDVKKNYLKNPMIVEKRSVIGVITGWRASFDADDTGRPLSSLRQWD